MTRLSASRKLKRGCDKRGHLSPAFDYDDGLSAPLEEIIDYISDKLHSDDINRRFERHRRKAVPCSLLLYVQTPILRISMSRFC